jgi:Domain of unknown function (DUF4421)
VKHKFLILLLFFIFYSFSQEEGDRKHARKFKYSTKYRVNYFNKMILKVDLNSDIDNFFIPRLNYTNFQQNSFIPNEALKLRFSFDYKFLGVYFSSSPDFLPGNNSDPEKGDTKSLDLSFKFFYTDKLRQEVTYKKIKGFYLRDFLANKPIEIFSDLEITTIGGRTFYIMNSNFSYRAFESQTERQIRNSGSLIPSFSYFYNRLETNKITNSEINLTTIKSFDAFLQVGYMYNFVLDKKWFATAGAHPGVGLNTSNNYYDNIINNTENITKTTNVNFNIDVDVAIGYNDRDFFGGTKFNYKNFDYNNKSSTEIINSKTIFTFYVGYRFDEIKPIKKAFEFVEDKLGI